RADRNLRGQVAASVVHGLLGHRFRPHIPLAEPREYLGDILALDLEHHDVPGPRRTGRRVDDLRLQLITLPAQLLADDPELSMGEALREIRDDGTRAPTNGLASAEKRQRA